MAYLGEGVLVHEVEENVACVEVGDQEDAEVG